MKSYISAEDYCAGNGSRLLIEVESDLTGYELLDAVREAAKAFLRQKRHCRQALP